jgi:hypothetical protein
MPPAGGSDRGGPTRSRRVLATVRSHVRPGSFSMLLGAGVALYILNGAAMDAPAGAFLSRLGHAAVMAASLYVVSYNRPLLLAGVVVSVLVLAFELRFWPADTQGARALEDMLAMSFQAAVFVTMLREVFRPSTSELDAVVGALGGFLLLLMLFMRLHGMLEALTPGSYFAQGPPFSERTDAELDATFQYFSTVTLTTVGFGDIVPVAPAARLATGLEAIIGQLYLAVVIATLVGRVAARRD